MNICVFGGSFDPIHLGHENIINILLSKFDKVIVMPSKQSPGKNIPIASESDRLEMIHMCDFTNNPKFILDEHELKIDEPSFTINSISHIKNKFKKDNLFLALGLDQFNNLSNWHDSKNLRNMVNFICFNRSGEDYKIIDDDCELIDDFNYDVSSSEIKKLVKINYDLIKNMVNQNIFNYIINKEIYK